MHARGVPDRGGESFGIIDRYRVDDRRFRRTCDHFGANLIDRLFVAGPVADLPRHHDAIGESLRGAVVEQQPIE